MHIGAYDISERIHRDIQPLRRNVFEAVAYLRSEGVFFALNHPFFFFKGQMPLDDYLGFALPAVSGGRGAQRHDAVRAQRAGRGDRASVVGVGLQPVDGDRRQRFAHACAASARPTPKRRARRATSSCRVCAPVAPALVDGTAARGARPAKSTASSADTGRRSLGAGRQELSWPRRTLGLAFSAVSMPFEFSPLVVAALHKRDEARRVDGYRREWERRSSTHDSRTRGRVCGSARADAATEPLQ